VFIIVLENKTYGEAFGASSKAPYLARTLPSKGALLPNYFGVTHESLGNYIALVSGQGSNPQTQADCQVYTNMLPGTIGPQGQAMGTGCVYPAAVKTVADQLAAAGLTWKGYMEDMGNAPGQPATCRHPGFGSHDKTQTARVGDQYAARHNPFVYFHSLLDSGACARDDVPLDRLPSDLASAGSTPNYSFITPNLCDDGHDAPCVDGRPGGLKGINSFLQTWVPRILSSPAYKQGGLLAIVFDEADGSDASACCHEPQFPNTPNNGGPSPGRGGGRTGAVLLSPFIAPGTVDQTPYNHFSLLRSVEDLFGLDHLGYAAASGLQPLGSDAFTCYRSVTPVARHGRLRHGSEIKSVTLVRRKHRRPQVVLELWHPGRVVVATRRAAPRHHGRWRRVGRVHHPGACQRLVVTLPRRHGRTRISARAFHGVERRTLKF
jgi:hypothetical protein